jgi:hypothetical protein
MYRPRGLVVAAALSSCLTAREAGAQGALHSGTVHHPDAPL